MKHMFLSSNVVGQDFVLADVNGCYKELMSLLDDIEFSSNDRLFLLGNLINYGLYSEQVVDFCSQSNVFPMIGNEEYLMLHALSASLSKAEKHILMKQWDASGGNWRHETSEQVLSAMYDKIMDWPLSITIDAQQKVGLVHSECPFDDWDFFTVKPISHSLLQRATLGQQVLQGDRDGEIANVDIVISGHTQLARPPVVVGKCHYINHGMVIGRPAKIYNLSEFFKGAFNVKS